MVIIVLTATAACFRDIGTSGAFISKTFAGPMVEVGNVVLFKGSFACSPSLTARGTEQFLT